MATCYRSPPCRSFALLPSRCSRHSSRSRRPGVRRSSWSSPICSAPSAARPTPGPMSTATATSITSSRSAAARTASIATTRARSATSRRKLAARRRLVAAGNASGGLGRLRCGRRSRSLHRLRRSEDPREGLSQRREGNEVRRRREGRSASTLNGVARQPAWIDYDGDGDLDLFAAFRDVPNRLLRNDRGRFVDVTAASGIGDPRKTVSAVWWDFDRDGDLDLFTANQEGEPNGLYRQDQGRFEDVAAALGVERHAAAGGGWRRRCRAWRISISTAISICSSPTTGTSALYRNDGGLKFTEVSRERGIDLNGHGVTSGWGDLDNDGLPDLYVAQLHRRPAAVSRRVVRQRREAFVESLPDVILKHDATHGVQFVDFDRDGRLDLALDQQRSRRRRPSAAAQHRDDARAIDCGGSHRSECAPHARRQRGARLSGRHARRCCRRRSSIREAATARRARCRCIWASPTTGKGRVDIEVITIAGGTRHASIVRDVNPDDYRGRSLRIITTR